MGKGPMWSDIYHWHQKCPVLDPTRWSNAHGGPIYIAVNIVGGPRYTAVSTVVLASVALLVNVVQAYFWTYSSATGDCHLRSQVCSAVPV